jgi:hypothetical protein
MAEISAVHSGLLLSLTAELEKVARLCCLPSGWTCHPSLRLTPKGASLLVHWSPSPAAETKRAKGGKKTKRRKRSAASQQRSAERAALHKARQGSSVPRQPLNPAAAPFTQTPIPPAPNSVPAAGQSAAEDSERVEGRIEGSRLAHPVVVEPDQSAMSLSGPEEAESARGVKRGPEPDDEELEKVMSRLLAEWSEGRTQTTSCFELASKLDSLKGEGATKWLFDQWDRKCRQVRQ